MFLARALFIWHIIHSFVYFDFSFGFNFNCTPNLNLESSSRFNPNLNPRSERSLKRVRPELKSFYCAGFAHNRSSGDRPAGRHKVAGLARPNRFDAAEAAASILAPRRKSPISFASRFIGPGQPARWPDKERT